MNSNVFFSAKQKYDEEQKKNEENVFQSAEKQYLEETKEPESFLSSAFRNIYQIPSGLAQAMTYPLDLLQMLSSGEAYGGLEEFEAAAEKQGIPFDREKYLKGVKALTEYFPTQSNIERIVEEKTGLPLTPQTGLQKAIRMGTSVGKLAPGTGLQKTVAGVTAPAIKTGLEQAGVPEPIAEIAGVGAAIPAALISPKGFEKVTKPSGIPARRFEKLEKPREITEKKFIQINDKIKKDFDNAFSPILVESPIGETAQNLANNPKFKQQTSELLQEVQTFADKSPVIVPSNLIKKKIIEKASKNIKGFALNEYDKSYIKFMKESIKDILPENIEMGNLIKQYRKNNGDLSEYFEPGASKALNKAKRDAILDRNRVIAEVVEGSDPEVGKMLKDTNDKWSKIMDVEAIDKFTGNVFTKEGINYKNLRNFFDNPQYQRIFKRALGEKGFNEFEKLVTDVLSSEKGYKMLRIGKRNGWVDLAKHAFGYFLHPTIGWATFGKDTYRYLMNELMDKPQLALRFKKAVQEVKKGQFEAASKDFEILNNAILPEKKIKQLDQL